MSTTYCFRSIKGAAACLRLRIETVGTILLLLFVIFFDTMCAFGFYLESRKYLNAQETSLLGSMEPLSAIIASVVRLITSFGVYQWLGCFIILLMVFYLSIKKEVTPQSSIYESIIYQRLYFKEELLCL